MSGHSKWSTIKRKKGAADAKRGALISKLIREISIAVKEKGPDPNHNSALRQAVSRARDSNVPMDTIHRAISKGSGEGQSLERVTYEGYGPAGVAILVDVLTDNRNRTASELRYIFSRNGGTLGESGCVSWIFLKRAVAAMDKTGLDEETLLEILMAAGADDYTEDKDYYWIQTSPDSLELLKTALTDAGAKIVSAEITMFPKTKAQVSDERTAAQVLRLLEALEDQEDVQNVYSNWEMSDELLEAVTK